MTKSVPSFLDPKAFGSFTRDRILGILEQSRGTKSATGIAVAATFLSTLAPDGPNPGNAVTIALDVLAQANVPIARELLWQAAEYAANARIRVEAIRRCGPFAKPEQRAMLREWATRGFTPNICFQHDQVTVDCAKEAAITALGETRKPSREDIDTALTVLTPPADQRQFCQKVFDAAAEAYWRIGDVASLPELLSLINQRRQGLTGITLISLAAKFTAEELKPHGEALRNAFHTQAQQWQDGRGPVNRLVMLAEKLAIPEFFGKWASSYGQDGLEHGRGKITIALLRAVSERTAEVARAFLALAQWPGNVSTTSPILEGLAECVCAGHGKLVAKTVLERPQQGGYGILIESGHILKLYDSSEAAVGDICESLSSLHATSRQTAAKSVAIGILTVVCREVGLHSIGGVDIGRITGKVSDPNIRLDRMALAQFVRDVEQLDPSRNPIVSVARLVCPPASLEGAVAIVEQWFTRDPAVVEYVMRTLIREAGRSNAYEEDAPMLRRCEQLLLAPGEHSLRSSFEAALRDEIMLDERLNRYTIEVMQRENLSFSSTAHAALDALQCKADAQFLLDRLHEGGMASIAVLTKAVGFHRDGDSELTEFVRRVAIAHATGILVVARDRQQQEGLAGQLHKAFYDTATVRAAAYEACGRLASLGSISALRARQATESDRSAKAAMEKALACLKEQLIQQKPPRGTPQEIRHWLTFVADLGDSSLVPYVRGYLIPPHADEEVRKSALNAIASMRDPAALEVVKQFTDDTAPEGETLVMARRARLALEQRKDVELFDALAGFYDADADVLDPAINYEQLLGASLLHSTTKALTKAQEFWEQCHWDEFVTRMNGIIEALVRQVFRTRYSQMKLDQQKAAKIASNPSYASVVLVTQFRNTFGKLQAHANTLLEFRRDSATAHVMNTDGSPKAEATQEDADYVRDEFPRAFAEAIKALR